jgi:hypothetical protein
VLEKRLKKAENKKKARITMTYNTGTIKKEVKCTSTVIKEG